MRKKVRQVEQIYVLHMCYTATAVRPGGEIVPSEDVSLQGDPAAIASTHLPSLLKTCRPQISDAIHAVLIISLTWTNVSFV
jgi:hypothetical protein